MLSLAEPQFACFSILISVIPCLAKKPFVRATINGAASTIGRKPIFAVFTSGSSPGLTADAMGAAGVLVPPDFDGSAGGLPAQLLRRGIVAAIPAVARKCRRVKRVISLFLEVSNG